MFRSHHAHRARRLLTLVAIVTAILTSVSSSTFGADKTTTRYFEQLRRRQLFGIAEGVCIRQLGRDDLSVANHGQLTLELSRTYAEHAKYSVGNEQQILWKRARLVIADSVKKDMGLSVLQTFQMQLQRAIAGVLESEFLLWDTRMFADDAARRTVAETKLAAAVEELRELGKRISRTYHSSRLRKRNRPVDHVLVRQLKGLMRLQNYQLTIAILNHASAQPIESPRRKLLAEQAGKLLRDLVDGSLADPIVWNSRLMLVTAARLEGDNARVVERLKAVERKKPPLEIVDRTVAERLKVFLAMDRPFESDQLLETYRKTRGGLPGELSFLRVRTDLTLWAIAKQAKKPSAAARFLRQATANASHAEKTLGGYWGYRCRVLISNLREEKDLGSELAKSIRAAEAAHRARKWNDAITAYQQAIENAQQTGKHDTAVKLLLTLGSLRMQTGQFAEAATAFVRIPSKFPQHARAADAHLMWAYCLGRVYDASRTSRTKENRLAYTSALEKHRTTFSTSATAAEATWMLALLQERRLQLTAALELYLSIPAKHRRTAAAEAAAARCLEGIHDRLRELKRSDDLKAWEDYAIEKLAVVVRAFPEATAPLELDRAEVLMRLARIQLNRSQPDYRQADSHLQRVFDGQPRETPPKVVQSPEMKREAAKALDERKKAWKPLIQIARQLRIVSLAGSGRTKQAQTAMAKLADAGASEVLAILDGLMQLTIGSDATTRRNLGLLQLQAAMALDRRRKSLSVKEQAWLDRCLAQANAASGQTRRAIETYEKLLAKSPRNRRLLETTAQLLMKSGRPEEFAKAETYWRRLESTQKKGSRQWLSARYFVALALQRQRKFSESRKLLSVTKLLYPQLGDAKLRGKYESLLNQTKPR